MLFSSTKIEASNERPEETANFSLSHVTISQTLYENKLQHELFQLKENYLRLLGLLSRPSSEVLTWRLLMEDIRDSKNNLSKLSSLLENLEQKNISWPRKNRLIELSAPILLFSSTLFKVRHLHTILLTYPLPKQTSPSLQKDFDESLHELQILYEVLTMKSVEQEWQEDLLTVWNLFFRILFVEILPSHNYTLLNRQLESLNFYWNSFLRKSLKERKNISRESFETIITMQNRWNFILKMIFQKV